MDPSQSIGEASPDTESPVDPMEHDGERREVVHLRQDTRADDGGKRSEGDANKIPELEGGEEIGDDDNDVHEPRGSESTPQPSSSALTTDNTTDGPIPTDSTAWVEDEELQKLMNRMDGKDWEAVMVLWKSVEGRLGFPSDGNVRLSQPS